MEAEGKETNKSIFVRLSLPRERERNDNVS
jgi:hypothetical protein